jgi:cobalt-zinc-cadmium efflux system outer membrane protein
MIAGRGRSAAGLVLGALLGIAGCVTVPRDAGFDQVERAVRERTGGQHVRWNRGGEDDAELARTVRELLSAELTSDRAVQAALLNNPSLQATYEDLAISQSQAIEAATIHNPTLSAEVRFPRHAKLPFEVELSQTFVDLLLLPMRKRAGEAAFAAARLRVTHEVLELAAQVKVAFYRAQGAAQLSEMRQSVAGAAEASFAIAQRLHDAGNITDLALANEQALYEQAKLDLARAQADAVDAREELAAVMGLGGGDESWTMAARLPELPENEIGAGELESLAVAQRQDLAAAREEVLVATQNLAMTAKLWPFTDAAVTAHLERDPDGTTTFGPGISLPLPIFNQNQPAIATAQARLRQAQARAVTLDVQVRSQVRRAANRMLAARDRALRQAKVVLPLRRQIVRQTQLQYNAMLVGVFQLLEAKRAEIDAGREYIESLIEYWTARAQLERAVGGKLATPAPTTQPHGE